MNISNPTKSPRHKRLYASTVTHRKQLKRIRDINDNNIAIWRLKGAIAQTSPGSRRLPKLLDQLGYALNGRFLLRGNFKSLERATNCWTEAAGLLHRPYSDVLERFISLADFVYERYERLGELTDLDKAIEYKGRAVSLTAPDDPGLVEQVSCLRVVLRARFERLGKLADLNRAIEYGRQEVSVGPSDHSNLPKALGELGILLHSRFQLSDDLVDLDEAIGYHREAVSVAPMGHPELTWLLHNLCSYLATRFKQSDELTDLDEAIDYGNQAVLLDYEDQSLAERLANLSVSLHSRFNELGELADLDRAIECERQAVSLTPQSHPDLPWLLHNLGFSLRKRFRRLGELIDIDEAIECQNQAVLIKPQDDSELARNLVSLGISLHARFEKLGELADLDRAIECESQAASLTPLDDPDLSRRLDDLGTSLHNRFERLGDLADLHRSIEYFTQAISLPHQDHLALSEQLDSLGVSLHTRFQRLGNLEDLEKSIKYSTQSISLATKVHSVQPTQLENLGILLHSRFQQLGDLADIEKSIDYKRQAVSLTPEGHPALPKYLSAFGLSFHTRFKRMGDLADLDKSIELCTQTISLTPEDHLDRPKWLNDLGVIHHSRFLRLGDLADLDKSIIYSTQAISLTPEDHSDLHNRLRCIGTSLLDRSERLGDLTDLDQSIEYKRQALSLTPEGHPDRARGLSSLSASLRGRFMRLGDLADLDKDIEYCTQAISLAPEGDSDLPTLLNNLGVSLRTRFEKLRDLADLDKSIEYGNRGVSLMPEGHSYLPVQLDKLGMSLYARYQHLGSLAPPPVALEHWAGEILIRPLSHDLPDAIRCFQRAAESPTGPPEHRFHAALHWARLLPRDHTLTILAAYKQVMKILPQVVWLGSSVEGRYRNILEETGSVSTEAASAAITMQGHSLALEWLEEGRSIVWKQMMQLRTPFDDLFAVDLELATKLKQVAYDLDYASSPKLMDQTEPSEDTSPEQTAQRHRRLAEQWEQLLDKVRQLPGFEEFLRPKKASHLMHSAQSGPVVLLNIHESHCAALVIQPGATMITHIPLQFSSMQAAGCRTQMLHFVRGRGLDVRGIRTGRPYPKDEFRRTLGLLWKDVVKPVLKSLGYLRIQATGDLPHITWCTTGPLSFLPLHAAGDYDSEEMIFNYVVSSYTPTLGALLSPNKSTAAFSGILVVGQESTPGMNPLPGTVAELTQIQKASQGHIVKRLDRHLATPNAVMAAMEQHSWVHLACHASQNPTNPLESAFYLHGGRLDLSTITQRQLKDADLAFLSACQTATGDESLSEEAVHLAAGMLMAGYRSVIATMWSIGDEDAPLIAEKVYEHLLEGSVPDSRRAAVAVHKATERLRAKVGVGAFQKWVPYIHIGQ